MTTVVGGVKQEYFEYALREFKTTTGNMSGMCDFTAYHSGTANPDRRVECQKELQLWEEEPEKQISQPVLEGGRAAAADDAVDGRRQRAAALRQRRHEHERRAQRLPEEQISQEAKTIVSRAEEHIRQLKIGNKIK